MYALEHYKSIFRPKPEFRDGQRVAIVTYGGKIIPGTVLKKARVWMEVRYDFNKDNSTNRRPVIESFNMDSLKSRESSDRLIVPEVAEFNAQLEKAREIIKYWGVEFTLPNRESSEQFIFYMADALTDFFGPIPEKANDEHN